MRTHLICEIHGTTASVGPGTLLEELECVACVAIQDQEYAASRQPCCSRMNIDCCGHDEYDFDSELPAGPAWAIRVGQYGPLTIESANYCEAPPF